MRKRAYLDRLLFAIAVHGPAVAHEHLAYIRRMRTFDKDAYREIMQTLRDAGMERADISDMVLGRHPHGCACWGCVLSLNAAVTKAYHYRMAGRTQ